jgi:CubicO group peptidase (beta-lactamase class C family)
MSLPGSEYLYSTHGFTLLAAVIEKVTGVPFNKVIRRRVDFLPNTNTEILLNLAIHQSGIRVTKVELFSQLS